MNRLKDTYKHMAAVASALLLALSVLPACSDDEGGGPGEEEGKLYTLTIALSSASSSTPTTKAVEDDDAYERRLEKWWVLVYGTDGDFIDYVSNTTYNSTDADSRTSAEVRLPEGTYHLYAFANLNTLTEGNALINKIENDGISEDELKACVANLPELTAFNKPEDEADTRESIPMSSFAVTTTVSANQENSAEIPLYRMLGKVRIRVYNQTEDTDMNMTKLTMGKFRKGSISLIPYWQTENLVETVIFPESTAEDFVTPAFNDYTVVNEKTTPIPLPVWGNDEEKPSYETTFYQYETAYTEENTGITGDEAFRISINAGTKVLTDYETDFDYMRRNDLLEIPIYVSNIQTKIAVHGPRMPIGGTPEEITYGEGTGIQVATPQVYDISHAGVVTVEYAIESISGVTDYVIKYDEGGSVVVGEKFSSAIITDNNGEGVSFIHPAPEDNEIELDHEAATPRSGSFSFTLQELGNPASATIRLNLIAEYGEENNKREINIPYIITITNTKEGGN